MKIGWVFGRLQPKTPQAVKEPRRGQTIADTTDRECRKQRSAGAKVVIEQQFEQACDPMNPLRRLQAHAVRDFEVAQCPPFAPSLLQHRAQARQFIGASGLGQPRIRTAQSPQLFFSRTRSAR